MPETGVRVIMKGGRRRTASLRGTAILTGLRRRISPAGTCARRGQGMKMRTPRSGTVLFSFLPLSEDSYFRVETVLNISSEVWMTLEFIS